MIVRIEAETLTRTGAYRLESNSLASGGRVISFVGSATNETGTARGNISIATGTYDIFISYFDENDGAGSAQVKLGGQTLDSWTLNQNLGSNISTASRVVRQIATGRTVTQGELLEIIGTEQSNEHVRIDYIEFRPVTAPAPGVLALSAATYSINENGTPVTAVTVTRTGGSSGAVSATLTPSNGTATDTSDYNSTPIVAEFANGETSKTVTIPILNDSTPESNETINLTLSAPTNGATLGTQTTATLTIVDNDFPPSPGTLAFGAATYSVNENGTPVTAVTVTRTGGSSGAVSATLTPTNGTATDTSDYNNTPILVEFANGETSKTVTIPILNDNTPESNETINLTLSAPTNGATLGTQTTATLTIVDNDAPPAPIRIEAETLTRTGAYRLESNSLASAGRVISFVGSATNETGTARGNISVATGTYDIFISYFDESDGAGSAQVKLGGQTLDSWTLNQNLGSNISTASRVVRQIATGRTVTQGELLEIIGTEQSNEHVRIDYIEFRPIAAPAPGVLALSAATYSINENGTPVTAVTVTRTGGSSGAVSATLTPSNGTATDTSDYNSTPIVVEFANGETSKTVTIPIVNDSEIEGNETLNLTLSALTGGATLGTQTTATLTIVDNDFPPSPGTLAFGAATYSVNENGTPVTAVTVTRTGGSSGVVSATLTPTNGTATAPGDYDSAPLVVQFANGETSKTVTIPILNDSTTESNETINLTLSAPTNGATLGTQTTATLTIVDNDAPPAPIRIEAETLTRTGAYRLESNSLASAGRVISFVGSATNETGTARGNISVATGTYDIFISYFDESDGAGSAQVKLGGQTLDSWTLNQNLGSNISTASRVVRQIATGRTVTQGELLEIIGTEQSGEHVRIDYIEFRPIAAPIAAVTIAQSGGSTNVTEGGNSDTYSITLSNQPTADVTVAIAPNSQVSTDLTSLTFTSDNWNQAQTITVNAINDTSREAAIHPGVITHTATSSDSRYNNISAGVTVNVTDDDRTNLGAIGTFGQWQEIEIDLPGPDSSSTGTPNPFLISVDVTFTGPGGTFTVPAFYDGNGTGGNTGNLWRVRFSANTTGDWSFTTSSANASLNGYNGTFSVNTPSTSASTLFRQGRLSYDNGHYLRFANGDYWIKGGSDDPEAILGTALGTFEQKKATIDYLASRGVNSVYIITNNLEGDNRNVWPWLGTTESTAKTNSTGSSTRFDVARLQQWEDFFTYVQNQGMVLHIVLEDDGAWSGFDRELYYRQMIGRFGHLPGVIWNIAEEAEENYSRDQVIQFANQLRSLDPYDHPVTAHRSTSNVWSFTGESSFDLTSMEVDPPDGASPLSTTPQPNINTYVINNRNASIAAGRPIAISIDETSKVDEVNNSTRLKMRSEILYPIYLAGGIYELHYSYRDPITGGTGTVTPTQVDPMWNDMRHARRFIEALPFNTMAPNNALLSNTNGNFAFAQTGIAYGIYLRNGGSVQLDLRDVAGTYRVRWYNVLTGEYIAGEAIEGGDWRTLTSPLGSNDIAVEVVNIAHSNPTSETRAMIGTSAAEALMGDAIANVMHGLDGDDTLMGEAGDDRLDGGAGNNTLDGGHGFDTVDYSQATTGVVANLDRDRALKPIYGGLATPNIMPLGDSITAGQHRVDPIPGAYRIQLFNRFTQDGFGVNFVGSLSNGPTAPFDQNHQGHSGWTIDEIRNLVDDPGFLESYQPDVILMMIGTNDTSSAFESLDEMKRDLDVLITEITARVPNALLVVSTIPPSDNMTDRNARITAYNNELAGIVNAAIANNRRVTLVDAGGGLELSDLTTDGVHPTAAGYNELGDRWYEAISDRDILTSIENVIGSAFQDTLIGDASVNTITGGAGGDRLTGGAGIDTFVYQQLTDGNDTITDFGNQDFLQLSATSFSGLTAGMMLSTTDSSSGVFVSGTNPTAISTNPHVLYNTASGVVSFDADGLSSRAGVAIATLQGTPALAFDQIIVGV